MTQPLSREEVVKALSMREKWSFSEEKITRNLEFKDHPETMLFLNALAHYSEKVCHHPEVAFCYNKVKLSYQTHDAGCKVTQKDLDAADFVETLI